MQQRFQNCYNIELTHKIINHKNIASKMSARILSLLPLLCLTATIKSVNSTSPKRAKNGKIVKKFQPFFSSGEGASRFLSPQRSSKHEENIDFVWVPFANSGLFASESDIDNMEDFREVWLNSPNQIIWRRCDDCTSEDHKNIFYRRWDDNNDLPEDFDLIDLLTNNWFSSPQIQGNDFNVDFSLYSSYEDAVNDQNRWTYCNFNDPTVGFPRDCSPSSYTPFQWNSFIRTDGLEKKDVGFYIESRSSMCNPNQMKVDVSITTDQYPEDTYWLVASSNGETFHFSSLDPMSSVESTLCLDVSDCHEFFIYDSWGDGLREGNFSVAVDDEIVLSNPPQPFTSMSVELCNATDSPTSSPTTSQPTSVFDSRFVTAYEGHDCTGKNVTFSVNHEEDKCGNCWETCFKMFNDGSLAHTHIKSIYIPEGVETQSYVN